MSRDSGLAGILSSCEGLAGSGLAGILILWRSCGFWLGSGLAGSGIVGSGPAGFGLAGSGLAGSGLGLLNVLISWLLRFCGRKHITLNLLVLITRGFSRRGLAGQGADCGRFVMRAIVLLGSGSSSQQSPYQDVRTSVVCSLQV